MSNSMTADITMRVNAWLDRFSPPRQIANNPQAMQDDANAVLRIFLEHAPSEAWQAWFDDALRRLEASMTTRSWPAPGEVVRACRGAERPQDVTGPNSRAEAAAVDALIGWYQKFGTQMPGMGNGGRTRKLVQRGIFRDLAEARFKGFTLFPDDERAILADRAEQSRRNVPLDSILGHAEYRRHVAVLARIRGVSEADVEIDEAARRAVEEPVDFNANRLVMDAAE